jgi:hypothetical protein
MRSFWMLALLPLLLSPSRATEQCGTQPVELYLLGGFQRDRVKVVVDGKLLFNDVITTNESSGYANHLSLKRVASRQKVSLLVNGLLLNTTWLDPTQGCMHGYGFSKRGYFIDTQVFFKAPMFN